MKKKIGLTTTVPVEVVLASGNTPVDLNNILVTSGKAKEIIERAEVDGFPRNICAWIKGLYATALIYGIDTVVGVTEGDCSNTKSLIEVWNSKGVETLDFGFPGKRTRSALKEEIDGFMRQFSVSFEEVESVRKALEPVRRKLDRLDRLTWESNKVSGFENHLWQVSSSDFNGDPKRFSEELDSFISEAEQREPYPENELRLGYIGVPPIIDDIYSLVELNGARVVYNEVQRAFTMAKDEYLDVYDMYLDFNYPYDLETRIYEIAEEIERRKLDGIIHYTQSFCHRGIEDIVIKSKLDIPVLTVEGDLPGAADARTRLRLESFLDMMMDMKEQR
jgi:benzoyl-CoA reductase/2-hydroxyglutaryl-CoA dehydratase subunit BcrC/BadD/HgdB